MTRLLITLSLLAGMLPRLAAEPSGIDHSRLLVYRGQAGGEHPVKTPADWAKRRRQIVDGMQQAMGPLPSRTALPSLDMRVRGDGTWTQWDGARRSTCACAAKPTATASRG